MFGIQGENPSVHVGDGRLQKLHKDAYSGEFDYESFATCESCIMDKLPKS